MWYFIRINKLDKFYLNTVDFGLVIKLLAHKFQQKLAQKRGFFGVERFVPLRKYTLHCIQR